MGSHTHFLYREEEMFFFKQPDFFHCNLGHNFLIFKTSEKENYQQDKIKYTIISENK